MQLGYYMAIALSKCLFKCFTNVFNLLIDFNFSGIVFHSWHALNLILNVIQANCTLVQDKCWFSFKKPHLSVICFLLTKHLRILSGDLTACRKRQRLHKLNCKLVRSVTVGAAELHWHISVQFSSITSLCTRLTVLWRSCSVHTFALRHLRRHFLNTKQLSWSTSSHFGAVHSWNVWQREIAKNSLKPPILGVQGRSRSLMLVPLESSSAVLVMIRSKSLSICNRYARRANSGEITIS